MNNVTEAVLQMVTLIEEICVVRPWEERREQELVR